PGLLIHLPKQDRRPLTNETAQSAVRSGVPQCLPQRLDNSNGVGYFLQRINRLGGCYSSLERSVLVLDDQVIPPVVGQRGLLLLAGQHGLLLINWLGTAYYLNRNVVCSLVNW